mmetsp:Transcript_33873/g.108262  ORF Transcript_33873/g.108262 Transcript_33873/m.108262 type:complete len:231 (-) Transcript_33873:2263-2955(-)
MPASSSCRMQRTAPMYRSRRRPDSSMHCSAVSAMTPKRKSSPSSKFMASGSVLGPSGLVPAAPRSVLTSFISINLGSNSSSSVFGYATSTRSSLLSPTMTESMGIEFKSSNRDGSVYFLANTNTKINLPTKEPYRTLDPTILSSLDCRERSSTYTRRKLKTIEPPSASAVSTSSMVVTTSRPTMLMTTSPHARNQPRNTGFAGSSVSNGVFPPLRWCSGAPVLRLSCQRM